MLLAKGLEDEGTNFVTFLVGEKVWDTLEVPVGEAIGKLPEGPAENEEGVPFAGWYSEGALVTADTLATENMVVTADFQVLLRGVGTYTVNFYNGDQLVKAIEVEPENSIGDQLPGDIVKEGYHFDGWFADASEVTADTVPTADMDVYAQFTELIDVTFNPNTEDDGTLANIVPVICVFKVRFLNGGVGFFHRGFEVFRAVYGISVKGGIANDEGLVRAGSAIFQVTVFDCCVVCI